jgi:enterochelin esterase family protein
MWKVLELVRRVEQTPDQARGLLEAFCSENQVPVMDGDHATFFFWDGRPTQSVFLQHWVFGLESRQEFRRIPHTDAFYLPLDLPRRARVEYKLEVVREGRGRWTQDPRNPRRAYDPFGSNSVCPASSYEDPEWTTADGHARKGTMQEGSLHSEQWGGERHYRVYVPYGARAGKRYPLLLVHDGDDYLRFAGMETVLDNLIHRHEVAPLLVCFTSGVARNAEYAANPKQADFLATELLPHLRRRFAVLERPEFHGIMGASFGAVSSLFAAVRHPGVWGRLLLQSGSFAFTDVGEHARGRMWDPIVGFVNGLRDRPPELDARIYQSCGTFESLIYYNRSLFPLFQKCSNEARFTEAPDGHNWINWRDRLREGLGWLFPGPLWMYYE